MFSLARKLVLRSEFVQSRNFSAQTAEKWDLISAVSLERLPIVTRELKDMEKKFFGMLTQIEKERSHKSNFELRVAEDKKRAKELEKGAELDLDNQPQQTAQDFLDSCIDEAQKFKLAKRLESPEVENNPKSLLRAKDRRLLLLVKDSVSEDSSKPLWLLPQGKYSGEPSLRATAEKALLTKCGPNLKVKWMGNAPAGFYKYKYPKSARKEAVGAKIFFFKAQLLEGNLDGEGKCKEFRWATRKELSGLQEDYRKSVSMFLVDEEH